MYAHLRIYTVNKGMMDAWLNLFNEKIIPLLTEASIKVESTWVNEEKSQLNQTLDAVKKTVAETGL